MPASVLCIALNPTLDVSAETVEVRPTRKTRTVNQRQEPGGGGVNVARVIAELGGRPHLAFLAGGATGALLDAALGAAGVPRTRIAIDGMTRVAFTVHETKTGFEYRFVPEGPEASAAAIEAVLEAVRAFDGKYVVASGSLPRGAPADLYARIGAIARGHGARFVLDAADEALRLALDAGGVFLVKPSIGELERYAGRRLDEPAVAAVARDLVSSGKAENVAVTFGVGGALLVNAEGETRLPARKVPVKSAVGAGDAFVGAFVHALATGATIDDAFLWGSAAGAAAVMTEGVELCRRADVEALHAAWAAERASVDRSGRPA